MIRPRSDSSLSYCNGFNAAELSTRTTCPKESVTNDRKAFPDLQHAITSLRVVAKRDSIATEDRHARANGRPRRKSPRFIGRLAYAFSFFG